MSGINIIIDTQTGVNYLWTGATGMSPLYNADGSLIVTPKKTEE
ncbi:DUF6440 family protein [Lactobacillus sp. YT155]|nr:DUF6440 family protein [Lactobacillus sp. YT155]MDO1604689.1 DUF6440 family protein [Lactobacillus sp. YT155]